jgi:hypothetical protein
MNEEKRRKISGLHVTYHRPEGKDLLSYWLEQSGNKKLEKWCGRYAGNGPCLNCGWEKQDHQPILVGDVVYYSTDSFGSKRQTWRVKNHYKKYIHPHFINPEPSKDDEDFMKRFTWEFIAGTLLETKLMAMEANPVREFTYCFTWKPCIPEEAEAVSLYSVCGAVAPLETVEYIKKVDWTEKMIEEEKKNALRYVEFHYGALHSDFMWD